MDTIAKYFDYYSDFKIEREEIFSFFSEETMLLAEDYYRGVGLSSDNVYFKVHAELKSLEDKFAKN